MLCKNPFIRAPDPKNPKKFKLIKSGKRLAHEVLPCGQCLNCRINKARLWTSRLRLELLDHGKCCFATLTYNDDNLPIGGTLVPEDCTKFFKRLRDYFNREDQKKADACMVPNFRRVRYYYCGEYGERGGRPHYHLALFGICQTETDIVEKCWRLGNVYLGELNKDSIRYIAGYIMKGMTNDKSEYNRKYLQGRHPEFQRMSRMPAIGTNAIERIAFKSKSTERFKSIKQGPQKILLGRTMQGKADAVLGLVDDGIESNEYFAELYRKFHVDYEDYKTGLVEGNSQRALQQSKRFKRTNRRNKI